MNNIKNNFFNPHVFGYSFRKVAISHGEQIKDLASRASHLKGTMLDQVWEAVKIFFTGLALLITAPISACFALVGLVSMALNPLFGPPSELLAGYKDLKGMGERITLKRLSEIVRVVEKANCSSYPALIRDIEEELLTVADQILTKDDRGRDELNLVLNILEQTRSVSNQETCQELTEKLFQLPPRCLMDILTFLKGANRVSNPQFFSDLERGLLLASRQILASDRREKEELDLVLKTLEQVRSVSNQIACQEIIDMILQPPYESDWEEELHLQNLSNTLAFLKQANRASNLDFIADLERGLLEQARDLLEQAQEKRELHIEYFNFISKIIEDQIGSRSNQALLREIGDMNRQLPLGEGIVLRMPGDGDCLFWSFHYHSILHGRKIYDNVRKEIEAVVRWEEENCLQDINLLNVIQDLNDGNDDFHPYFRKMRGHSWGGHPEILALQSLHHLNVVIRDIRENHPEQHLPYRGDHAQGTIILQYTGRHYNLFLEDAAEEVYTVALASQEGIVS